MGFVFIYAFPVSNTMLVLTQDINKPFGEGKRGRDCKHFLHFKIVYHKLLIFP